MGDSISTGSPGLEPEGPTQGSATGPGVAFLGRVELWWNRLLPCPIWETTAVIDGEKGAAFMPSSGEVTCSLPFSFS